MTAEEPIYWRTHAGFEAWACADSGLPAHYREILAAMAGPTSVERLKAAIPHARLAVWLGELHTLGFVQTGPAAAAYYRKAA